MADSKSGIIDPHAMRTVDLQLASKGSWLVKVPKYLADKMKSLDGPVGSIKLPGPSSGGGRQEVLFVLNESARNPSDTTPAVHKFVTTSGFKMNLAILSETESGKLAVEGRVIQRMECQPYGDSNYMQYKIQQVEESNKPTRQVILIDKPVNTYKPVSTHAHLAEHEAKKKSEGKRSRDDADHVKEVLFKAFEQHQYYTLRDLHNLSKQPLSYLKDILKEICRYNLKAPHKNMYELKPEYRHYDS